MVRRFLTVRWVTITLLAISVIVVFLLFGRWQLHRWESRGTKIEPPDARPPVALSTLVSPDAALPGGSIGRQATAAGSYDTTQQVLVPDRRLGDRTGYWVVTPLRPAGGTAGAAEMVVRGWVPTPNDPALRAPSGPVTVTGRLYASEDPPPVGDGTTATLPPGQLREVNTAELTGRLPYRILDGYLLLARQSPAAAPAPALVPAPANVVNSGGGLRNLAYAIQWCLFAFAVVYFYARLVRDEIRPPEDRVHQPAEVGATRATDVPVPASAPASRSPAPAESADDEDDPELAAYNRYLAELHARSTRSARR